MALTRTVYWQQLLDDGVVGSGSEIAKREGLHHSAVNERLRLTLLEPAIIQAIVADRQPRCMSLLWWICPRTSGHRLTLELMIPSCA